MGKLISIEDAVALISDGARIMFGGFMGCGNAHKIIDALSKSGKSGFTMIGNDAAMPGGPLGEEYYGVAKLVHNRQIKRLIASHVGLNPEVARQMSEGSLDLDLIPQGSLVEMIRAGGAGLGGVLTPTGVGTVVQNKSEYVELVQEIGGKSYLLMKPLRADFAIISGHQADVNGNIWYKGTTRNFNMVMATAADVVIAEADHIVEIGGIEPENVMTSGVFVDYIVDGGRM
ncbi:MAG: CoA transferase subunit A [Gracilibacteraceae bacterium]|jgi:acetate CoA/acetoacetate CoA-transferase alpha subunit|nr:CoA transferase subunit A [Gracilibacteraceae bacterium]